MIHTTKNLLNDQIKRINNMSEVNSFTEWLDDLNKETDGQKRQE